MVVAEQLNQVVIDTRWGDRSFELWHGDITRLSFPIDLLVIAQPGRSPTYSLHRALKSELGISVRSLKETQELDFTQPLGVWVSRRIGGGIVKRIMCMEIMPDSTAPQKIRDAFLVFPILVARDVDLATICLPILGAGGIGLRAEDVVRPILEGSYWALSNIKETRRICFVDIAREKALTMSKAMDDVLGRIKLSVAGGGDTDRVRNAISIVMDKALQVDPDIHKIVSGIRAAIKPDGRSVHLGNAGRQLCEYVVGRLVDAHSKSSLFSRIDDAVPSRERISELNASPAAVWMNGYFHLLRLLGNEVSHHKGSKRIPEMIDDKDLVLILLAMERVLDFWVSWCVHRPAAPLPPA